MRCLLLFIVFAVATPTLAQTSTLFIGNSFTYGWGSPVRFYRAETVTDLNDEGIGGVPALFKSFTVQAGLPYDVYLETRGGSDLNFHLENKKAEIGSQPWDTVVMHSYSTLSPRNPGKPAEIVAATAEMSEFLRGVNPDIDIYLTATWSRADLVYVDNKPWTGTPIEKMAMDVRAGYDLAAVAPGVVAVNGVGEAWIRAMDNGIADPNPYDGIDAGKVNLWSYDHYHASAYGYYLEALVVFGSLTGLDPRSLGAHECSAFELGFSPSEVIALQLAAYEQLASEGRVEAKPAGLSPGSEPRRCGD